MKRYRPTEDGMAVSETGMWVRHTDAAELQRQLADERAKHDETLTTGEKLLAATNELQRQLAEVTAQRDGHRAILQNIRDELGNAKWPT